MKQINGTAFNIEADILGRIMLKGKSIFNRKDEMYYYETFSKMPFNFS